MKFSSPALHNKLYNFQQRDICTYIWAQKFGTPIVLMNKIEILQSKTRKMDKEKGKNLKKLLYCKGR